MSPPKGMNCWENFGRKKDLLRFYANVSSKYFGYLNFMDCLEIWSKDSQDTNIKKPCGELGFFEMDLCNGL